ncbi:MAG: DUF4835 family protein [Bacteroidetes bacterium]|nr:DUF4835 family protein [Bacteroidota bacterium]
MSQILKKLLFTIILFSSVTSIHAQEILCSISVSSPKVEGTDRRVFETLQTSLYEFVNNRQWTNYSFQPEERIECSILITIDKRISADEFSGKLNLILRRPVYKTSFNASLFNYVDNNFQFQYIEYQSLDYSDNTFSSNLTSVIAYYINIFLGLDFDSFSLYGGTPFFDAAQNIVNAAQNSPYQGWKAYENSRNRYWLVENLLNPAYQDLREFSYEYHRKGLDVMSERVSEGRSNISRNLNLLKSVNDERPNLFILQLLMEAKRDEFINLYSDGSNTEKTTAIDILSGIDPANSTRYQEILSK